MQSFDEECDLEDHFSQSSKIYWDFRFNQDPDPTEVVNHRLRADLAMIANWNSTANERIKERFNKQGPYMENIQDTIKKLITSQSSAAPDNILLKFAHAICPLIAHNEGFRNQLKPVDTWICGVVAASNKENTTTPVAKRRKSLRVSLDGNSVIDDTVNDGTIRKSAKKTKASTVIGKTGAPVLLKQRGAAFHVDPKKKLEMVPETSSSSQASSSTAIAVAPVSSVALSSSSPADVNVGSTKPSEAEDSSLQTSSSEVPFLQQRAIYAYAARMPPTKTGRDKDCFVCMGKKDGKLLQCEGDAKKGLFCCTRFHEDCIMKYNAGEYSYEFMKEHYGSVCPLHHCSVCMIERRKTSALLGELTSCQKCFRAFHQVCLPATVQVEKQTVEFQTKNGIVKFDVDTFICHAHAAPAVKKSAPAPKKKHLPFCCECETDENRQELLPCSKCIRSFHSKCHQFSTIIDGDQQKDAKQLCEGCIYQEVPRSGQNAIARYQASFYPCKTVSLAKYPAHCRGGDAYGQFFGKPGYIAVEWSGCTNLFNLRPAEMVVPMFTGSYDLYGKRLSDREIAAAWAKMEENCDPPQMPVPLNDNYIPIDKSEPVGKCKQTKLKEVDVDQFTCSCDPKKGPKCDVNSSCSNRDCDQECPSECKENGNCHNRVISDSLVHPDIERRVAAGKGYGVFAKSAIKKGVMLAEYAGEIIDLEEKQKRVEQSAKWRNNEETHYMMSLDPTRIIDCKKKGNIARFINHSCDPNCKMQVVDIVVSMDSKHKRKDPVYKMDKRVGVRTIRDIEPDEELTFNYQMDQYAPGIELPMCMCGSENCTGKLAAKSRREHQQQKETEKEQKDAKQTPATKIPKVPVSKRRAASAKIPKMRSVKRRAASANPSPRSSPTACSSSSSGIAASVKKRRRSTVQPEDIRRRSPRTSMASGMPQLNAEPVGVVTRRMSDTRVETGADDADNTTQPPRRPAASRIPQLNAESVGVVTRRMSDTRVETGADDADNTTQPRRRPAASRIPQLNAVEGVGTRRRSGTRMESGADDAENPTPPPLLLPVDRLEDKDVQNDESMDASST